MKHTVTVVHEVEAESWDLAAEAVIKNPWGFVRECTVKSPGKRLVHLPVSVLREAAKNLPTTEGE